MTTKDKEKWDNRYLSKIGEMNASPLVDRYWQFAHTGNALDIACGNGRNSLFLAEKGFTVDAVDISSVATNRLEGKHTNLNVICADLDAWTIPVNRYDIIVNVRFLERRIFPLIISGLKPGGVLIFDAFMSEKKSRYCLRPNELLHAFSSFRVVYYEEKKSTQGERFDHTASFVAVKPCQPLQ